MEIELIIVGAFLGAGLLGYVIIPGLLVAWDRVPDQIEAGGNGKYRNNDPGWKSRVRFSPVFLFLSQFFFRSRTIPPTFKYTYIHRANHVHQDNQHHG